MGLIARTPLLQRIGLDDICMPGRADEGWVGDMVWDAGEEAGERKRLEGKGVFETVGRLMIVLEEAHAQISAGLAVRRLGRENWVPAWRVQVVPRSPALEGFSVEARRFLTC